MNNKYLLNESTEELLLKKISQGDIDALEQLYKMTSQNVFSFAMSILKNSIEAEDVMHDVYLTIYDKASTYKHMNKPLAWILTITRNECLMRLRKSSKFSDTSLDDIDNCSFFSKTESVEEKLLLKAAFNELSSEESQIVMLHIISGFTNKEISAFLKMPINTVISKYNRSLKKLRSYIEKGGAL